MLTQGTSQASDTYLHPDAATTATPHHVTATAAIKQLFSAEDPAGLFRQLDEDFIKPKLLLDGGAGGRGSSHNGGGGNGPGAV
jgi:sodium/hydrogen exchanger-like protein 6/7